jgi:hypothetical protein
MNRNQASRDSRANRCSNITLCRMIAIPWEITAGYSYEVHDKSDAKNVVHFLRLTEVNR